MPAALLVLITLAVTLLASSANAQAPDPPHLTIPRVTRPPQRADFESMDPVDVSSGMRRVEGFVQRFPNDGEAVSERTIVYVGYDSNFLYAAFICFDSAAERIGAHLLPRDSFPNDEDTVAVHIDTFRDLKHAYGFQVNSYGVQTDGIYTEGQGWDLSWDTVWRSEAVRTSKGYIVLYRIPFKSLRFPASELQQWGMFFYRGIARKNEQVYWPACSTRVAARFRQAAIVDGIERVSPGRNVQAIPYVASRSFRTLDVKPSGAAAFESKSAETAVGIDGKAVVRDSIVLDLTVNPDFSQVESDQPQITVNRPFEVFFPEKRPFFLENATYFSTPIQLLFTRRIADPLLGGRATGRAGPYAIGAIVVDDHAASSRAWFGAARAIRDVGGESFVGAFVSDREDGAAVNRVAAIDGRVKIGANWFAVGQGVLSGSRTADRNTGSGAAASASLLGSGRRFNYQLDYNDRSPGFRADNGFIPRVDLRSVDQTYSIRARPAGRVLQAWGPDVVVNRTWDYAGRPLDWSVTPRIEFQWPGTTTLDVYHTAARQTLRPSEIATVDTSQRADVTRTGATFTSSILPRLVGSGTWFVGAAPNIAPVDAIGLVTSERHGREGGLPQERILDATVAATIRVSRSLMFDVSYLYDRLKNDTARPTYTNTITRIRVGEQFTRALALRAIVQYSELTVNGQRTTLEPSRNLNYDLLFTYLTAPGTAIYVGANYNLADVEIRQTPSVVGLARSKTLNNTGWQIFTKMSYLFRR